MVVDQHHRALPRHADRQARPTSGRGSSAPRAQRRDRLRTTGLGRLEPIGSAYLADGSAARRSPTCRARRPASARGLAELARRRDLAERGHPRSPPPRRAPTALLAAALLARCSTALSVTAADRMLGGRRGPCGRGVRCRPMSNDWAATFDGLGPRRAAARPTASRPRPMLRAAIGHRRRDACAISPTTEMVFTAGSGESLEVFQFAKPAGRPRCCGSRRPPRRLAGARRPAARGFPQRRSRRDLCSRAHRSRAIAPGLTGGIVVSTPVDISANPPRAPTITPRGASLIGLGSEPRPRRAARRRRCRPGSSCPYRRWARGPAVLRACSRSRRGRRGGRACRGRGPVR